MSVYMVETSVSLLTFELSVQRLQSILGYLRLSKMETVES
jgi:hypothetical protein